MGDWELFVKSVTEIFDRPELKLPIEWRWGVDPEKFMRDRIEGFFRVLDEVAGDAVPKPAVVRAKKTASQLMEAFSHSLKGAVVSSYSAFRNAMDQLGDSFPTSDESTFGTRAEFRRNISFRMRRSQKRKLEKAELFHIPFEKRFKVASERFSVLGSPCLYLGGSVYTCWEEMQRPPFHDLHVSAFWINKPTRFLDLRMTPEAISSKLKDYLWRNKETEQMQFAKRALTNLAQVWPLMALCMMKVSEPHGSFKPEYIVPQMTLHWIANDDQLDGVAYASCQASVKCERGIASLSNYAFPVKSFRSRGRCVDLCERFRMTNPINWSLLGAMDLHVGEDPEEYDIEVDEGVGSSSGETEFGKIERALFGLLSRIDHAGVQDNGVVPHD